MTDLAALRHEETTFFARSERDCPPFLSAPLLLIQGIHESRPELARKIVRNRVFTTAPMSESLHGMVRVSAKRVSAGLSPDDPRLELTGPLVEIGPELVRPPAPQTPSVHGTSPESFMELAFALAARVPRSGELYARDRPVAALLVSSDDRVLAAAVNTNARNRTCHAEINLVLSHWAHSNHSVAEGMVLRSGRTLPAGSRIFVTLKPCKMCAGMIWDCSERPGTVSVFYGEDDPGVNARNTVLDRAGLTQVLTKKYGLLISAGTGR